MIILDIDGVLTVKETGVNINTKMTDAEIKDRINNAKPARQGFALLNSFLMGFVYMFHCIEAKNDALAWQQIGFLTGRKKSEYYEATKRLFTQWAMSQGLHGSFVEYAMSRIMWCPENLGYKDPMEYFIMKENKLKEVLIVELVILYVDDDRKLVDYLNNLKVIGIKSIHFESKE